MFAYIWSSEGTLQIIVIYSALSKLLKWIIILMKKNHSALFAHLLRTLVAMKKKQFVKHFNLI